MIKKVRIGNFGIAVAKRLIFFAKQRGKHFTLEWRKKGRDILFNLHETPEISNNRTCRKKLFEFGMRIPSKRESDLIEKKILSKAKVTPEELKELGVSEVIKLPHIREVTHKNILPLRNFKDWLRIFKKIKPLLKTYSINSVSKLPQGKYMVNIPWGEKISVTILLVRGQNMFFIKPDLVNNIRGFFKVSSNK